MEPAFILYAFLGGVLAMAVRLPPLAGFLVAGFALNYSGYTLTPALETIASLGVTLLLFTIGLKLKVRTLLQPEIWGTATLHVVMTSTFFMAFLFLLKMTGLVLLQGAEWSSLLVLGFAVSFSSTVFAVKLLEERSETKSFYGRLSIGILIMQDIFAVLFITASSGELPSPWALGLLLLIPAAPWIRGLLDRLGHGEMQVLFGFLAALVLGYHLFEWVGLKGDLGALIVGILLAPHRAAGGLAKALFNIKELFLVGFFLSIGLTALPTWQHFGMALLLLAALPVKTLFFMLLLPRPIPAAYPYFGTGIPQSQQFFRVWVDRGCHCHGHGSADGRLAGGDFSRCSHQFRDFLRPECPVGKQLPVFAQVLS